MAELSKVHRCEALLGVLALGCFGEVLYTEEMERTISDLKDVRISRKDMMRCLARCSLSVTKVTAKTLVRRAAAASREYRGGMRGLKLRGTKTRAIKCI